jgi:transglutaminase/protease-like cytokinesis protein 3
MKFLFSLCFVFCISFGYSQNYKVVDSIVRNYPKSFTTPKRLADRIQHDFTSESDKARAAFTWIASNISYDVASWLNPKPSKSFSYTTQLDRDLKLLAIENETIATVLRKKSGVCQGYSLLYHSVAVFLGLECRVINGMGKVFVNDIGLKKMNSNHAWNSVKIDGVWRLIDVTWGAGSTVNQQNLWIKKFNPIYFDANPKFFFKKHLPNSGVWETQILNESDFLSAPLFYDELTDESIEILEPKSGIIEANDNQKIKFKIKNSPNLYGLSYVTNKIVSTRIKSIKDENDILEFDVDYTSREGRFFTLIVNNKSFATFKIIQKIK